MPIVPSGTVVESSCVSQSTSFASQLSGRDRLLLVSDLLPILDFAAWFTAAYVSSIAYALAFTPDALSFFGAAQPAAALSWTARGSIALLGAVIASFVMYDPAFAELVTRLRFGLLARSFFLRFATTSLLVLAIGNGSHLLDSLPPIWIAGWLATSLFFTGFVRWFAARRVHGLTRRGALAEAIAIVGAGPLADDIDRQLRQRKTPNVELVGIFDDAASSDRATPESSAWPVQKLERLFELAASRRLDWIVLAVPESEESRIRTLMRELQTLSIPVALCSPTVGLRSAPREIDYAGSGLPVFLLADRPIKRWNVILKSVEDIVLSWIVTLILLPVLALIALAIRLDSPGPIVFKQRRHTFNNREFDIYKFRTMRWQPPGTNSELQQTVRNDPRVTRVGKFLRETSLDELPQLFNVLRGEMSLIGPRPHAVNMRTEDRLGHEITDRYAHRHRVKPGMTGWSQVNGARGATDTIEQLQRRIDLDLYYVDNWSLWLDFKILWKTFQVVVKRTNAY